MPYFELVRLSLCVVLNFERTYDFCIAGSSVYFLFALYSAIVLAIILCISQAIVGVASAFDMIFSYSSFTQIVFIRICFDYWYFISNLFFVTSSFLLSLLFSVKNLTNIEFKIAFSFFSFASYYFSYCILPPLLLLFFRYADLFLGLVFSVYLIFLKKLSQDYG